jgi:hypothetical protein
MDDERPDATPPDPSGIDEAHDVLAAEEFGMPARDERFPPDPTGNPEAHDVLAAEEFAMPTATGPAAEGSGFDVRSVLPAALGLATLLFLLRRLRR